MIAATAGNATMPVGRQVRPPGCATQPSFCSTCTAAFVPTASTSVHARIRARSITGKSATNASSARCEPSMPSAPAPSGDHSALSALHATHASPSQNGGHRRSGVNSTGNTAKRVSATVRRIANAAEFGAWSSAER